jgi:CHAT domain-containing protein
VRKSIVGLKTRNRPLTDHFYEDEKLKVLLVSSNVSGPFTIENKVFNLPEIPGAREEVEQIEALIREKQEDGKVRCIVDVKHDVTCEEMAEVLQEGKYDVIHYSGHAMYSETPENSSLFFRKKRQNNQLIIERLTTNRLNFLVERTRLKFFYLSCCQGAMVGTPEHLLNNDFLGITHALLVAGVPSVLAMRWPLTDEMAVLLAASFYRELFKGVGLELALLRARRQLQSSRPNDHSWLSPVLVVQSP